MQLVEEKRRERINHVTDKLRSLSLSTDKLIRLVERIHERQMDLSPENKMSSSSMNGDDSANEATSTFMIGAATNAAVTRLRTKQKLSDLLDDIVNATSVLDEERTTSTVDANGNSIKNISSNDAIRMAKFQMPPIRARVKELRKAADAEFNRRLAYEFSTASKNGNNGRQFRGEDETLDELVTRTMTENGDFYYPESNKNNTMSEYLRNVVEVPMWVPLQLLPFVVTAKPEDELSTKEWKELKSEVFQGSRFFVTSWDSMRFAAVYRGNFMRVAPASTALPNSIEKNIIGSDGKEETPSSPIGTKKPNGIGNTAKEIPTSQIIFSDLQNRLEQSSLKDKIQLFLVEEYDDPNGDTTPNPVVIALPKAIEPERASERGNGVKVLSGVSVVLTLFTTFAYSVSSYALNPTIFNSIMNENDIMALSTCIPLALGVIALHATHELAHIIVARLRKIRIGLPVPLPSLQIGTFGSITPLRSFPESRSALLDVALAGPAVTIILSLALMMAGIILTKNASAEALSYMPVVPAVLMRSSFAVGSMVSLMAPKIMMLPLSQPVPVHPAFMVGLTGLVSSALNLLPIGRLDGGRACMASLGRRTAMFVSFILLIVLLFEGLFGFSTVSIFWGILVVLFQRNGDIAMRDEVTKIDGVRMGTYLTFMALTALILAPFPGGLGPL